MKYGWVVLMAGLLAAGVWAAPVAVIQGSESVAAGERRFAQALARHVERWFREAGVDATLTDDADLSKVLAGKKVAVLVYLALPTAPQMAALTAFAGRGGRLIVCYSSSPALAGLMGVQAVGYQKGSTDGRWSQMRFVGERPRGVPDAILQTSQNLFLVQPVAGRSHVMAWWHDRQGRQTGEPAWLSSAAGYWMTHVLLADGEAEAKGRLLLALAAAHDPALWQPAAARILQNAKRVGGVADAAGMVAMAGKGTDPARRKRAVAAAQSALQKERDAAQLLAAGKGFEAWQAANDLRERMYEVYGMLQPTRAGEIRAVWDHSGMGSIPATGGAPAGCSKMRDSRIFTSMWLGLRLHITRAMCCRARVFSMSRAISLRRVWLRPSRSGCACTRGCSASRPSRRQRSGLRF